MTGFAHAAGGSAGRPPELVLLPLADAGDRALAGGKGASLRELCRAGVAVPAGFVVTTAAFRRAMAALDPGRAIPAEIERLDPDDREGIEQACERVRDRIAHAALPADIAAQLADGYRNLGGDPGLADGEAAVAVRSSATGEDSAQASFAGLQDTYLWVRGADTVADRVRACWASLYNTEAASYRRRMGIGEADLAMAVVVQRMVDARCAGVMFTCSPTTGDRSVITVEASWGLGSAMVSGDVTPDRYVLSKVTGEILSRTVAAKLQQHRMDDSGSGVVACEVPEPLRQQPCLTDDEVRSLAKLGRHVEAHFGAPQDIEWAIAAGAPSVLLLQSRPETYWSSRASQPIAVPLSSPVDHVFAGLSRSIRIGAGQPDRSPEGR